MTLIKALFFLFVILLVTVIDNLFKFNRIQVSTFIFKTLSVNFIFRGKL